MEKLRGISKAQVFPLHANLTSDEQRRVFVPVSEWKIIVSTNVAEVSAISLTMILRLTLTWAADSS